MSQTMQLDSLVDLYVHELEDMKSSEQQLVRALPRMAKMASCPQLRRALEQHYTETQGHLKKVESILERLDVSGTGTVCRGMEGIIKESEEYSGKEIAPEVRDAAIISLAQRSEHYEIAGYGTLCTYACTLGQKEDYETLYGILENEKETDCKLTELAEEGINEEAEDVEVMGEPHDQQQEERRPRFISGD